MSTTETTADDMFMSINGFDEIAIAANFGAKITALREDPFTFLRSLIFVDKRREGLNDREAHAATMALTIADINDYFAEPVEDEDPGEAQSA